MKMYRNLIGTLLGAVAMVTTGDGCSCIHDSSYRLDGSQRWSFRWYGGWRHVQHANVYARW